MSWDQTMLEPPTASDEALDAFFHVLPKMKAAADPFGAKATAGLLSADLCITPLGLETWEWVATITMDVEHGTAHIGSASRRCAFEALSAAKATAVATLERMAKPIIVSCDFLKGGA